MCKGEEFLQILSHFLANRIISFRNIKLFSFCLSSYLHVSGRVHFFSSLYTEHGKLPEPWTCRLHVFGSTQCPKHLLLQSLGYLFVPSHSLLAMWFSSSLRCDVMAATEAKVGPRGLLNLAAGSRSSHVVQFSWDLSFNFFWVHSVIGICLFWQYLYRFWNVDRSYKIAVSLVLKAVSN